MNWRIGFEREGFSPNKRRQKRQSVQHKRTSRVIGRLLCEQLEDRIVLATILPMADGFTQDFIGTPSTPDILRTTAADAITFLKVQSTPSQEVRSELEFDLSSILVTDTITSARLKIHSTGLVSAFPFALAIYGYEGDGIITGIDHDPAGKSLLATADLDTSGVAEIYISSSFVSGLVDSGDILGILITASDPGNSNDIDIDSSLGTTRPELIIGTAEQVSANLDDLISSVDDLLTNGSLNNGIRNALVAKVEGANSKVTNGQNGPAINKLEAFINQVEALINSGNLTAGEGQPLIDVAQEQIDLLTGVPLVAADYLSDFAGRSHTEVTQSELQPIAEKARAYWATSGIGSESLNHLNTVSVTVADLPGPFLGFATEDAIRIDSDAAGRGWHVADGSLNGGYDLLTAVTHEFGHILGFNHDDHDDVMSARLSPRVQTLPAMDVRSFDTLSGVSGMSLDLGLSGTAANRIRASAIQAITDQPYLLMDKNRDAIEMVTKLRRSTTSREQAAEEVVHGDELVADDETALHGFFKEVHSHRRSDK